MATEKTQSESPVPKTRRRGKPQEKVPAAEESTALTAARSAELYRLAEELRAILDAAVDANITIHHRGVIVRINAAAERLFGYSENEMLGANISLLMPSPDREQHDGHLRRYLETGEARTSLPEPNSRKKKAMTSQRTPEVACQRLVFA